MAAGDGRACGGIAWLLDLIEEHEPAFTIDWRSHYGLPLSTIVDGEMPWGEVWHLTWGLLRDPATRAHASVAGWAHPWSREAYLLADLIDTLALAHTDPKKRGSLEPYPRPTDQPEAARLGRTSQPQNKVRAALARRGH